MKKNPMFSIITVCYNAKESIEDTLLSVLSQTNSDYQYIVIDGNSMDGTIEILDKYRNQIDLLLIEEDDGIYEAMNKAIGKADGTFIHFLNSGDRFFSESILSLVAENIKNEKPKIISGDFILEDKIKGIENLIVTKKLSIENLKKDFYSCHQSIFISMDIVDKFDLNYKIKADYKWVYMAVLKLKSDDVIKLDFPIVYYQQDGFSQRLIFKNLGELIKLHYELFGFCQVIKNLHIYLYRFLRSIKDKFI